MGTDAYDRSPAARAVFDEADAVLGFSLSKLIREGPTEELRRTENAQPAIFCVSLAYLRAMEELLGEGMRPPLFVAGHSLGEYTALVASGALGLADGVRVVRRRGELMQQAADATSSGMAAILGVPLETVQRVCRESGVQLANANSPEQYVVAGPATELAKAVELAGELGARRVVPLEVSGAFHTEVMRPAQEQLEQALAALELRPAAVPIVANTTALPISTSEDVRQELSCQLCGCVLWQQSVEFMASQGVIRFLEIGPGTVLTGLMRRIAPQLQAVPVGDLDALAALTVS